MGGQRLRTRIWDRESRHAGDMKFVQLRSAMCRKKGYDSGS